MMNHHLPAAPHVLPAIPLRPGRRPNEHYSRPPLPAQMPPPPPPPESMAYAGPPPPPPHPHGLHGLPHPHTNAHGHPQPHAHAYPPPPYRSWTPTYPPYGMPPVHPYQNAPLVVSSYPHSQPPPPHAPLPPPPGPQTAHHALQRPGPPMLGQAVPPPHSVGPSPALPPVPPRPASSSTQSQGVLSPSSSSASLHEPTPPLSNSTASLRASTPPAPAVQTAFEPPLPWLSVPEEPFPPRAVRRRRRRRPAPKASASPVELPGSRPQQAAGGEAEASAQPSTATTVSTSATPMTSQPPSEVDSTQPTTPSSLLPASGQAAAAASGPSKGPSRPILPAVPLAVVVPHPSTTSLQAAMAEPAPAADDQADEAAAKASLSPTEPAPTSPTSQTAKAASPPAKPAPRSWAELVRSNVPKTSAAAASVVANGLTSVNGVKPGKSATLAEALHRFDVQASADDGGKIAFLEPRGLINSGNLCYMNSVLQVLLFCVPFYTFLDTISKQAAHSFKGETPLLDAMIMFMREFPVIDSSVSAEQLRMRLKDTELEQYGEPFTPEFVYEVIRALPRFASMRDAEEFLGFLLEGLHDECVQVLKADSAAASEPESDGPAVEGDGGDGGWLEVGPKQKAAVTRSSGTITTESPITKIFGGKLRSELRVQGLKNSVTLEPYQPLQLDIQSAQISNISDALKGLTRSETLHGDFHSPRGPGATATKQVFIDTLPCVLILHLKRFQYDNAGGTQKIWKKVGYPLQLEIPKEVFSPHRRAAMALPGGQPRYRLIGVVYHHGKNASGGHYTVEVRRQDGREWIRLDDTVIRRVRSEDVAEAGVASEGAPATARSAMASRPRSIGDEDDGREESDGASTTDGWNQVNGVGAGKGEPSKRASTLLVNGGPAHSTNNSRGRTEEKSSVKDNKVAYLLFYQRM